MMRKTKKSHPWSRKVHPQRKPNILRKEIKNDIPTISYPGLTPLHLEIGFWRHTYSFFFGGGGSKGVEERRVIWIFFFFFLGGGQKNAGTHIAERLMSFYFLSGGVGVRCTLPGTTRLFCYFLLFLFFAHPFSVIFAPFPSFLLLLPP